MTIALARSMTLLLVASTFTACERSTATLGFWFEPVTFESRALGGALTPDDLRVIERVAREELAIAFGGLDVVITSNRDARYRVRAAQELFGNPLTRKFAVAGESRSLPLVGSYGAVNFSYFAAGAMVFMPEGTPREDLLAAIGRGLGRAAVHEFAHQLVRNINLHAGRDPKSYEYYAASRLEQYVGPMHWDIAGPELRKHFARQ